MSQSGQSLNWLDSFAPGQGTSDAQANEHRINLFRVGYKNKQFTTDAYASNSNDRDDISTESPELIQAVTAWDPQVSIPTLVEGFNIYDSGRHEVSSVYTMILKIGKAYPLEVQTLLAKAIDEEQALRYYVEELRQKLS